VLYKVARAEQIQGQSGKSLQMRGRAALLACQPDVGIDIYRRAIHLDPQNASLQLELGIALALDARLQMPLQYEAALEHVLRASQKRSPEFLFDSALLFQETHLPIQARERWGEAASAEPDGAWKKESDQRLTESTDFLLAREREISALSLPDTFLAANERQEHDGEELALENATEEWLMGPGRSPAAGRAVQHLSSLLIRDHHDRWLEDAIHAKASQENSSALTLLAQAIKLNFKGEHLQAKESADKAEEIFRRLNNTAGKLRAQFETVYSLDRQGEADDCLTAAKRLEREASAKSYIWIEAQARLEYVTCRARTRRWDIIQERTDAYQWVRSTGYQGLTIRALSFTTEEYVATNARTTVWRNGQEGLRIFWSTPLRPLRGYSFFFTLADSSQKAGNIQAALAVLREGTLLLKGSGLHLLRGILLSSQGQWEIQAGLNETANRTFEEMASEFREVAPEEIRQVWAEAEVAHAEALIATGRAREGLALLEHWTEGATWPYAELNLNLRRVLLPAFGEAYMETGNMAKACQHFRQSIRETRDQMAGIHNRAQRDNALREIEASWRGLTVLELRLNRPAEALGVWETFRSERDPQKRHFMLPNCESATVAPVFSMAKDRTALVYAFLFGRLSVWIVRDGKVEQRWLDGSGLQEQIKEFSALVADPKSSMEAISIRSAGLYKRLVAPFASSLPRSGTLVIDPDSELAAIPWGALEESPDHPLIERFSIAQAIGIQDLGMDSGEGYAGLDHALIFAPPVLRGEIAYKYPFLPDAAEEAITLHRLLPHSWLFAKDDANFETLKAYVPKSSLFHFPGHAISTGGFSALLMPASRTSRPDAPYVTAQQIAGLDLSRMQTVVLAACSTGRDEKNGVVNLDSLTRAFLEAGTRRVIAAEWDVDSRQTEDLMIFFYQRLKAGEFPAEALRQAQARLRQEAPHPSHWAAFQLFGEP
jgi:CHAT domain-containing protein